MTVRGQLEREAASLDREMRELEKASHDEGGFSTGDPRAARLDEIGRQFDAIIDRLDDIDMQDAA